MSTDALVSAATSYSPGSASTLSASASTGVDSKSSKNIDAVSKDFEAVFLSQMLSQMFAGEDITSYFGGGTAGDVYKSYLMNEYGKVMAQSGGIGIATQVKQELLKLQEVKQ